MKPFENSPVQQSGHAIAANSIILSSFHIAASSAKQYNQVFEAKFLRGGGVQSVTVKSTGCGDPEIRPENRQNKTDRQKFKNYIKQTMKSDRNFRYKFYLV